jgi:hypothetical protein
LVFNVSKTFFRRFFRLPSDPFSGSSRLGWRVLRFVCGFGFSVNRPVFGQHAQNVATIDVKFSQTYLHGIGSTINSITNLMIKRINVNRIRLIYREIFRL